MTKWDKFYNNQNPTTQAWLDAQAKDFYRDVFAIGTPLFLIGAIFGLVIGLSLAI
jgi:hypothetical protein